MGHSVLSGCCFLRLWETPLEGAAAGELQVCGDLAHLTVLWGAQATGAEPGRPCGSRLCGTQTAARHALLQLLLSYSFRTLLLKSSGNSTAFGVYVEHNDDENCVMFNGKMLNCVIWSCVIFSNIKK